MATKKYSGRQILITGGLGFIGSHLAKTLLTDGARVTIVDDFSRGTLDNILPIKDSVTVVKENLITSSNLAKVFEGHDTVFNLAALNTGVDYDLGRTQVMFEDNMLLQMNPLKIASKTMSVKNFVQVSSASVYSRYAMENQVPTPETADTSEPEPSKLGYGLAKKMGEYLAQWYAENTQLKTVCARFINVYGENDNYDSKGHFIPVMVRKFIEADTTVEVFGSGNQKRSFLYAADAVNGLLTLLDKGKTDGTAYNIDGGEERSVKEVVEAIRHYFTEKNLKINYDLTKPEGSQRRLLDSSRIKKLGWKPTVTFEEGLKRTINDIKRRLQDV